ncbi:hypothetical protein SNE25_04520 [Mucilaginibacter sabulilitoris]|uniref:Uncharacterized protein n=1 Tax=Mucilaginibacter sabulilitoris TaxID=1173583 RepID=A0ABZ0TNS1_9SPHI|nr:hypothetical protein [Mucilaginibacter sabulilitoris]WPU94784.1 hypothetical protein SNE25_04520 [Mucilaginibacter sabulilitoris]
MINPEDIIPLDDQEGEDKSDQQSQQDIHSNGLDEENVPRAESTEPPLDLLNQSYRAADSAYLPGEKPGSDYRIKRKRKLE